jgi:D-3-phosphoglycerate dehydrogenase / 2-oxoglutarate reductase
MVVSGRRAARARLEASCTKGQLMAKVLIIQPFHQDGMALLEARADIEVEIVDGRSEAELADKIRDADAATIRTVPLPAAVIERAERLKVVSRHGVGYDNVDVSALTRRGIPLAIAADANATAVAEHTLFFMLALAKQALRHDRAVREGRWEIRNRFETVDLLGRRVLILGYGRIGREVAKRCAAFDMQVSVYDPYVQANVIEEAGYQSVPEFQTVLPETDVLTVHMPLADESRHLIGSSELAALPAHALVINCARGGIIDEDALHEALTSGGIAGAGIDVFEQEPPPENHPLFGLGNVLLSPHTAGMSQEAAIRMAISTAHNALAGIDGKLDPSMVVNREVL